MILKYLFKRHLKKRLVVILAVCTISAICWILIRTLTNRNPTDIDENNSDESEAAYVPDDQIKIPAVPLKAEIRKSGNSTLKQPNLDIWSVVGLGDYTWEHILGGRRVHGDSVAELNIGNMLLRYHSGSMSWNDLPSDSINILLILNGRAEERLPQTRPWLDELASLPHLETALLMIIGNEECDNEWLLPYLSSNGGVLRQVFITYDTKIVDDNEVMQWPLGTATYRGFPVEDVNMLSLDISRPLRCNFMGTVYEGSSRERLMAIIEQNNLRDYCYVKTRQLWEPEETETSMEEYIRVLKESDLTLSPVGKNIECYRIYEAAAMGSVPVIEDVRTSHKCSEKTLQVLKDRNAPFIFIKDWTELREVLQEELKKSPEMIIERRKNLIRWYQSFKQGLRELLVSEIGRHLG